MKQTALGRNVRALRKTLGLTQEEACAELRSYTPDGGTIARETWSRIESGQPNADTWILVAMAGLFGTTVDALMRDDALDDLTEAETVRADLLTLSDQMLVLPKGFQAYLLRLFRSSVTETVTLLRASAPAAGVAPDEAWLLRALQQLPEARYEAFQRWLEGQERQVAGTNAATG